MKNRFDILFTIAVYHSYFKKDTSPIISVQPDAATASLMEKYGFAGRKSANSFLFYGSSGDALEKQLGYITTVTGASSFGFTVTTTAESLFALITGDLPPAWKGSLLYDSSSDSNTTEDGTVQLQYSLSETANTNETRKISIRFSDIIACSNRQNTLRFAIRYAAMCTQWNYYVINKTGSLLSNPAITSRAGPAVFGAPEPVELQTGEKALLFSSGANLIPLSSHPQQRFSLVDKGRPENKMEGRNGEKILFRDLPVPNPLRIAGGQGGRNVFSSPMYVYI